MTESATQTNSRQEEAGTASKVEAGAPPTPRRQRASKRRAWRVVAQAVLALLVLGLGGLAMWGLMALAAAPERAERVHLGPLVETVLAERADVDVVVRGHGTVEARVRASLVPEVSGRVVEVHDALAAGGFIEAGETVIRIDDEDYRLALAGAATELEQARAAEETAEAEIAEAEARFADAYRELARAEQLVERGAAQPWEQETAELARDIAQAAVARARSSLSTARASVSAAEVSRERAEVDLRRTTLTLPFDAVVIEEQVSVGQHVTAGQSVGRVYGMDAVEVAVPLEDREAGWLAQMPLAMMRGGERGAVAAAGGGEGGGGGPGQRVASDAYDADGGNPTPAVMARVSGEFFGRPCAWEGRVVRTEGQMDRQSRMVRVVVRVDDPFADVDVGQVPLLPGAFVDVQMEGRALSGVIPVPRYALHGEDDRVWIVDEDGRLRIRQVTVARRERETVYIQEGVSEGERVIISPLDAVTDGMAVRIADDQQANRPAADAQEGDDDGQR